MSERPYAYGYTAPERRPDNIILDYKVKVCRAGSFWIANSVEFFIDEHGIQWVKFEALNGYNIGKEHMLRTEDIEVVRL